MGKQTMKRTTIIVTALTLSLVALPVSASQTPPQRTEAEGFPPIIKTVYVDRIVYVDKPVIQTVTNTVYVDKTHNVEIPVTKIVKVEVPVYETMTVTNDPKIVRAMMKVTHDRYVALLAKYRELKAKK